jgi:hypothetical protein
MHKYEESKTTRIMMTAVRHVNAWAGCMKYQAAWILLNRVYIEKVSDFRKLSDTASFGFYISRDICY